MDERNIIVTYRAGCSCTAKPVRESYLFKIPQDLPGVISSLNARQKPCRQGVRADVEVVALLDNALGQADAIRDQLTEAGVLVEDTPRGPRWEMRK